MRCPKCGYISFDRQKSCGKCSNDLTAVAEQLQGTVGKSAAPFFLGAVLGQQSLSEVESGLDFHEDEDTLVLDELEAEAPPTDEEELDFAGAPLDEDDLEEQPLPSLGLEEIDVSDLVPPQEEEEKIVLHLGNEQKETILTPIPAAQEDEDSRSDSDEEDSLSGIEFSGFKPEDFLSADEEESPLRSLEEEETKSQTTAEKEEIIDLSSLMGFDETPAKPAADKQEEDHDILELSFGDELEELHLGSEDAEREEDHDMLELSLGDEPEELHLGSENAAREEAHDILELSFDDEPEELHLGLEDAENAASPKKTAGAAGADIPDLGLTLENDDQ